MLPDNQFSKILNIINVWIYNIANQMVIYTPLYHLKNFKIIINATEIMQKWDLFICPKLICQILLFKVFLCLQFPMMNTGILN